MRTLAVFAKHKPSTSRFIWTMLKATEILQPSPRAAFGGRKSGPGFSGMGAQRLGPAGVNASTKAPQGIASEHETIERKEQEYPATFGYACLIAELQRNGLPPELLQVGESSVQGDIVPHIAYIFENIFMRFDELEYSAEDAGQMWKLAAASLSALYRAIAHYDIDLTNELIRADFVAVAMAPALSDRKGESIVSTANARQPGFYVMSLLLAHDQRFLKRLFMILSAFTGVGSHPSEYLAYQRRFSASSGTVPGSLTYQKDGGAKYAEWRERSTPSHWPSSASAWRRMRNFLPRTRSCARGTGTLEGAGGSLTFSARTFTRIWST